MALKRIAIAGAGNMARGRGQAFLDTGRAEICAVASLHKDTARPCAEELGSSLYYDDYRRLADRQPDAILIEVPHKPQDEIVLWALEAGFDLLIGGSLASCVEDGERIVELTAQKGRVVEAGYQRRYDPAWEEIRRLVDGGSLGGPIMASCMGLWDADSELWYYDQEISGGMPLTHMSYAGLNVIRWVLGKPTVLSAVANQKKETGPGRVLEETCGTHIQFESGAFVSATASYAGPEGLPNAEAYIVCTEGGIQVNSQSDPGTVSFTLYQNGESQVRSFASEPSSFVRQAEAFLDCLESRGEARNPVGDALMDLRIADAISTSAREIRTIRLDT